MKLKVLWLYHDMMDLYGDKGNIKVLQKRCMDRDIEIEIDTLAIGEEKNFSEYDILFIGGGADREQALIYQDLLSRKQDIVDAMDKKSFVLLICGGYQLFGQYYLDQTGNKIEGLKILDYYTKADNTKGRCIGNIWVKTILDGKEVDLVGFENHAGQTIGVNQPMGKVIKGHGNQTNSQFEGVMRERLIGTYMHGPLLPKNPELADYIIKKGLEKNYGEVLLSPLDDTFEKLAKQAMIKRLDV
ncbi:MAG: glutamine amidotransferase [Erysipelotrichaceae bacterium]